jgi:dihydroxy-acid dehydratase
LSDEEIEARLKDVKHHESDVSGWLALYQKLVHSADTGAILR